MLRLVDVCLLQRRSLKLSAFPAARGLKSDKEPRAGWSVISYE